MLLVCAGAVESVGSRLHSPRLLLAQTRQQLDYKLAISVQIYKDLVQNVFIFGRTLNPRIGAPISGERVMRRSVSSLRHVMVLSHRQYL